MISPNTHILHEWQLVPGHSIPTPQFSVDLEAQVGQVLDLRRLHVLQQYDLAIVHGAQLVIMCVLRIENIEAFKRKLEIMQRMGTRHMPRCEATTFKQNRHILVMLLPGLECQVQCLTQVLSRRSP